MAEEVFICSHEDKSLVKRALAQLLYDKDFPQTHISKILGLSQPMVSNYCTNQVKIPNRILKVAENITDRIVNGEHVFFHTCICFSERPNNRSWYIADENEIISDENVDIINNLNQAFDRLKEHDLNGLIPEIKINIAFGKKKPTSPNDIASFLDGFIIVENKIIGNNGIRFGKSKHLSSLLLRYGSSLNFNAIMNIAYNKNLQHTHLNVGFFEKNFTINESKKNIDIVIHKGDFGIEPCAYVLGNDAIDVAEKILDIKEKIR